MEKPMTNPEAEHLSLQVVARIRTHFPSKFGVPRQSGVVKGLESRIVFEPKFRNEDALRGIEGYEYLWLIWSFSEAIREEWTPTVRPPWLDGNTRMGVFATRSPFRPNALALSSVKLLRIEKSAQEGTVLVVEGADMMDGTPIYDIKPYLPFTDSHPEARAGFSDHVKHKLVQVVFPKKLLEKMPASLHQGVKEMLAQNPIPRYQNDPDRIYGVAFDCYNIRFFIAHDILTVVAVTSLEE